MTYSRPGTYVDEVLLTQQTPVNTSVAVGAFVGPAPRGPVTPTAFQSWTEVAKAFGGFTGNPTNDALVQAIYDYLNNGGRSLIACRVVGAGAASSSLDFNLQQGSVNEQQVVTITGGPTGGTYTLSFDGGSASTGIAPNASATAVQAALRALPNVGDGDVTVTGSASGPYTVVFGGALAGSDVPALVADASGLTGGTSPAVTVTSPTPGAAGDAALTFTAKNPGVWGDSIYVQVSQGSSSDRFSLVFRLVPAGAAISNSQIVEQWSDLSLNPVDGRSALAILNQAVSGSAYVTVTASSGYAYTDGDVLAPSPVAGGTPLVGGADGTAVVDSTIAGRTAYMAGVTALDVVAQPFVLNLPGVTDTALVTSLANYADASRSRDDDATPGRGDVFVVIDSQPGVDGDAAITKAGLYPQSDVLAVYYPNLVVSDPSNAVPGSTKLVPPGGAVVGRYISTDAARGVFKSPAGKIDGRIVGAVGMDPAAVLRNPLLDRLNNANVNAIRLLPNQGPTIFGARTLKKDFVTRYVSARRTLIGARADLVEATSYAPFENNDEILWAGLTAAADKVLRELYAAGGLKGADADQAYYVKCDSENNTPSTIAAGEVHLEVGLALQRPAEFVVLTIAQFDGGVTVNEPELAA